jgi:hypothetical protein
MLSIIRIAFVALLVTVSTTAFASSDIDADRPSALTFELLGRGGVYSFDYDYAVSEAVAVGAGLSAYSATVDNGAGNTVSASLVIIPVYLDYYFSPSNSRGFLTGGLDLVSGSVSFSDSGSGVIRGSGALPVIGGGYEYRADNGFIFRAAPYLLFGGGQVAFTIGLSAGVAF